MNTDIRNTDDVIDSRDVIARIEELQSDRDAHVIGAPDGTETPDPEGWAEENPEEAEELAALEKLAAQAEGYGDWEYGETLIHDTYFVDYCEELVKEIGDLPRDLPGYLEIDWSATADNLRVDYMSIDFDGETYWMRS